MKKSFIDQLKREVTIDSPPKRIISLVPSQTELLYDLGLEEQVVGITKFCIHPEKWHKNKPRVGGTNMLHPEIIDELQPDLIIANKEENKQEQVETLMQKYPVWVSDVGSLEDALEMIMAVGEITNTIHKALAISKEIQSKFASVKPGKRPLKTAYLIWRKPYMVAGGDTFINTVLKRMGLINVFERIGSYVRITDKELFNKFPELILLSSEPYPFKDSHIEELHAIVPSADIHLVDGEMFSWYGSRLLKTPEYLNKFLQELEAGIR